jgi:pyruvate formate lyase activating enzyme
MNEVSRRRFLKGLAGAGLCALGGGALWVDWRWGGEEAPRDAGPALPDHAREAMYYAGLGPSLNVESGLDCTACHAPAEPSRVLYCHVPHQGRYVRCGLCPHRCVLAEGERGLCRVRENRGGKLYTFVYGNPCAIHVDPIEKKPLYHFMPGTAALSLATAGCNLRCKYCQNYTLSQRAPEETQNYDAPPEAIVAATTQSGAPTIAYTYSEPLIFYEYMLDTARAARRAGLRNVVISAGYVNPEPLRELCRAVDAIKIDLKGYNDDFYRQVCGGTLEPVLESIRTIHHMGVHLEIVNLVVPTLNDDLAELRALAEWVLEALGPDVPLHFSRFHPDYQLMNLPPTPIETLEAARRTALDVGLHYVYMGNVPGHEGNHTYCPGCGRMIVQRAGMATAAVHVVDGRCAYCETPIAGVWQ